MMGPFYFREAPVRIFGGSLRQTCILPRCMECRRGLTMTVRLSVKRVHCDKTKERSL